MDNLKLGLKENWRQFILLVIVNAFVGGMIGMERTIFHQFAEVEFGVASKTAIGFSKAITTETKIEDLALVCSNCHRMLHRKRP